jgi:hypothetical protein
MIIESAFYKLPGLLLEHWFPKTQYEATLVNYFALGIHQELNSRNVFSPTGRIHIDKPYDDFDSRSPGRADLYIDLKELYEGLYHHLYGMKPNNWLEVKFFAGVGRQAGSQTKTENAAHIILDLLRLCLFVKEERSKNRDRGRYSLLVFNRHPKEYLAFSRQSGSKRLWIESLLAPGFNEVRFELRQEPTSFCRVLVLPKEPLEVFLKTNTYVIEPASVPVPFLYWVYLVRIIDFKVRLGDNELSYVDASDEVWSKEQEGIQSLMVSKFFRRASKRE